MKKVIVGDFPPDFSHLAYEIKSDMAVFPKVCAAANSQGLCKIYIKKIYIKKNTKIPNCTNKM